MLDNRPNVQLLYGENECQFLPQTMLPFSMAKRLSSALPLRSSKNLRLSHICGFLAYMEGRSAAAYGHLYHEAARIKRMKTRHAEVKGVSVWEQERQNGDVMREENATEPNVRDLKHEQGTP